LSVKSNPEGCGIFRLGGLQEEVAVAYCCVELIVDIINKNERKK